VPDAPGLELIRGDIESTHPGSILATSFDRNQPALIADPAQILSVLAWLRDTPGQNYNFLSSLHVADYLPAAPRFGVHYELLNRDRVERLRVKAMLADPAALNGASGQSPRTDAPARPQDSAPTLPPGTGALPEIDSCVALFPTAEAQEREAFDFFGINFKGHPDMTRILLPEDYVGWPQRRDFPVGGEPVTFTYNEKRYG